MYFEKDSTRKHNGKIISQNATCLKYLDEMREIEHFLDQFGFLSFGRDYIVLEGHVFSLQAVLTSCELTVGSIVSCCEFGCIADANTLLRKYRDDLFFYLYILVWDSNSRINKVSETIGKMEKNILQWLKNDLSGLNIRTVMEHILQSEKIKSAAETFQLSSSYKSIGRRLNDYVHSNGISYYNYNVSSREESTFQNKLERLLQDIRFVTTSFVFLLTLCSPMAIMSNDYIDYLDCGEVPPEGSQYWVAPFILTFLEENSELVDKDYLYYLRDHTPMTY